MTMFRPSDTRYDTMLHQRSGRSGIKLPAISLGLWHNFGGVDPFENSRAMVLHAFDLGITHFDLANNYGPPPGSAEETFGRLLRRDLAPYRDELIISTKAGWPMWRGPYGDWGSRKYLIASLEQSLRRMGLDYVDIFYHHRAAKPHGFLKREEVTEDVVARVRRLTECARARGQTLAQMALAWVLRHPEVTSVLVGASRPQHVEDAVAALAHRSFASDELRAIDQILA